MQDDNLKNQKCCRLSPRAIAISVKRLFLLCFQQQQTQATNEAMIKAQEMQAEREGQKNATEIEVANIRKESAYEVALIQADASLVDILNNTGELEEESMAGEAIGGAVDRLKERQESNKQQENLVKGAREEEKMQLSRDKMANDLKIAKENKNKHDK